MLTMVSMDTFNVYNGAQWLGQTSETDPYVLANDWAGAVFERENAPDGFVIEPTGIGGSAHVVAQWFENAFCRDENGEKTFRLSHDEPILFLTPVRE